ncbi:hypothetical protein J6590_018356 [Homalodisca vitripennis]|nr:hypothetical protein J6590_018356 [Homalodisca vitripennis]
MEQLEELVNDIHRPGFAVRTRTSSGPVSNCGTAQYRTGAECRLGVTGHPGDNGRPVGHGSWAGRAWGQTSCWPPGTGQRCRDMTGNASTPCCHQVSTVFVQEVQLGYDSS